MRPTGNANSSLPLSFPVLAGALPTAAGVHVTGTLTSPEKFVLRSLLPGDLAVMRWLASSYDLFFQLGNVANTG